MKTYTSRARVRKLPLVLLFFGACRSLSHDGNGPAEADDSVAVQRPLTVSATPKEALAGRIVVPSTLPDFSSSVSTVGEPSVGDDGAASYRVPIWVPDGVAGLQPSLAIEYNSEGGVRLLGPRWQLSGLSAIVRCPKTLAQDGAQGPVDFFGDTFCMDGQRLVSVSSSATLTEFRTERESYTKILGTKDSNGDFVTFKVYQRDGRIFHYGRTLASRLHGNPKLFYPSGTTTRDVTYAYYVDKIEDRYSNSILITYANAVADATTGISQVQELEPAKIVWGSTGERAGLRSVTFEYDQSSIPAGSTVDTKHMRWVHGLGIGAPQYLTAINIFGPDGLGGTPRLKQYTFSYSASPATRTGTPLITGDQVLSSVTEGDPDSRAWKKTTQVAWEAGSFEYTRTPLSASDVSLSSYQGPPTKTGGGQTEYASQYRRMMAVDLNGDGRDDVVYRSYMPPHHSGYYDCLGWSVRTSQFQAGNTSGVLYLSAPTALTALGSDPDTSCRASLVSSTEYKNAKGPNAYVGDIVFADLNGDGRPDIISPIGKGAYDANANKQNSYLAGYRAYLSTGGSGALTFGNPINFIDSVGQPPSIGTFNAPKDATIAIGDTWGDGLPAVITRGPANVVPRFRSAKLDGRALVAKTETRGGQQFPYYECPANTACYLSVLDAQFPNGPYATEHLAVIDLDGDGTAEILRNAPSCPTVMSCGDMKGAALVQSPTMNAPMPWPPSYSSPGVEDRWFLDLNGDGLQDVVWGVFGSTVFAAINTGAGFGAEVSTDLHWNVLLDSPYRKGSGDLLVADFNLDGRQDLISTNGSTMTVLLSDGTGSFSLLNTTVSSGASDQFVKQNLVADLNADGLPDILNLEGTAVVGYIRQGQTPMMVTKITEGTGRTIEFGYDVASGKDTSFYQASSSLTCDKDPLHLECLNRARWLVSSVKIGGSDIASPTTQTFTYKGGVSDKRGRGFLGFIQRDIYGPGSRHEAITYDPVTRVDKTTTASVRPYVYPYALLPALDRVDVDTSQGPNRHHYETVQQSRSGAWRSDGTYLFSVNKIDHQHHDCPTVSGSTCSGAARLLLSQIQIPLRDAYGNLGQLDTWYYDTAGLIRADTDVINYQAADTTNWIVSLLDPTRPSTRKSSVGRTGAPKEEVTRTIKFTPDLDHGGIASVEIEPGGNAATHLIRTFGRDKRGRLGVVSEQEVATGVVRTTAVSYDNGGDSYDSDAVYPTMVRENSGTVFHHRRVWRHPGYGFVVEAGDPNGLAIVRSYDTFGRLRSETNMSGASTTVQYAENPNNGADIVVMPAGESTRMSGVHLDSWGREAWRTSPVDATHVLKEELGYDVFGRVQTKTLKSGPDSSAATVLNTYSFTYDDLDRLTSNCHLASDNLSHCATNVFDGAQVTATDEAGRVVTHIADAMGRPSIQRAALQGGTSDATFKYGPFGLLKQKTLSDKTGQTDIGYDVLGRQESLTRSDTGERRTTYNAFGDVVGTYKEKADGTQVDNLIYGRDGLGRLTSITGAMNRSFYWDAPASSPSTAAPYAIGKLVEVDENGNNMIRYEYGANGLLFRKTWYVTTFGPLTQIGLLQFLYDGQGRVSQLTYPTQFGNPVAVRYDYDAYNGEESSITDLSNPATPLWSASARNAFGQVTNESMQVSGGATISRVTDYYLQNGLTKAASLSGSNGQAQLTYSYDAGGLPLTSGMSGVGGSWMSGFAHDNLGRMTQWEPLVGAAMSFTYDSDGNLTRRAWSGETVNYDKTASARTLAVVQGGITVRNDTYQRDSWGRIWDTPAVTLTYNALDEVTDVTEKDGGRFDFIRRDGFGNRIYTAFGNPYDGQPFTQLFTLDNLYEYKSSNTSGIEERYRVRAGGRLVGELVRTSDTAPRTATFYLTDNVGSVVAEASSSGTVAARERRDPFGNLVPNASSPYLPSDPTAANPDGTGRMGFGDHARDPAWGVVDMVSRFYSPRLGRFISPDAILPDAFDRTQHNAFAYVGNSPAAFRDPLGYCGAPEGEVCPLPPIISPPGGPPPSGGERMPPYNPCEGGRCSCGDHECKEAAPTAPPRSTVVNRLGGAATCGSTSANAAKAAAIHRSYDASGSWLDQAAREGKGLAAVRRRPDTGPSMYELLATWVGRMMDLATAAAPGNDRETQANAGQQFGREAFKAGIGPISPAIGLARGAAAGERLLWTSWRQYPKVLEAGREYAQIGERLYTEHAVGRMLPRGLGGRGISPNIVEDAIRTGSSQTQVVDGVTRTVHTSGMVEIVTELGGRIVVTVNPFSGVP